MHSYIFINYKWFLISSQENLVVASTAAKVLLGQLGVVGGNLEVGWPLAPLVLQLNCLRLNLDLVHTYV